jgi:hypothetical protein
MDKHNAARRRSSSPSASPSRPDPLANFRAYLDEIEQAVLRRDAMRITALLRKRRATHLPREVREELLFLARAPSGSLRAPVQFLRFQHRMTQLAMGGERLPTAQTELRLARRAERAEHAEPGEGGQRGERGEGAEHTERAEHAAVRLHEGHDRKSAACDARDARDARDATDDSHGEGSPPR